MRGGHSDLFDDDRAGFGLHDVDEVEVAVADLLDLDGVQAAAAEAGGERRCGLDVGDQGRLVQLAEALLRLRGHG